MVVNPLLLLGEPQAWHVTGCARRRRFLVRPWLRILALGPRRERILQHRVGVRANQLRLLLQVAASAEARVTQIRLRIALDVKARREADESGCENVVAGGTLEE